MTEVPGAWYNVLPDLGFELPPDVPPPGRSGSPRTTPRTTTLRVPPALIRQEVGGKSWIPIPDEVAQRYRQWRPTPLRRAAAFERALGTRCAIFYKYEGGNLSGSHKLNSAVAQAYYYRRAGATRLVVGTGAGQWGTAVAAACAMFGLACTVYMVRSSYADKPYRRTMMEMLGASVLPSPSDRTEVGRRARADGQEQGSLSIALAEALTDAREPGGYFCTGSGETYTILHQTVIGLEAAAQLAEAGRAPDVVIASLGAGSNFGGLCMPFIGPADGPRPRCVAVEPAACPTLTRGRYAYDFTDASRSTPLQKMYTLGHTFAPERIHAGGLRYHGASKLVSALYDRKLIEAAAHPQRAVFASAVEFAKAEGVLPAPESAHAVHGAVVEARRADDEGVRRTILLGVSGHGLLDMAAYAAFHDGTMRDSAAAPERIAAALDRLPAQPAAVGVSARLGARTVR
ncbi:TrpB-like pyridoxal phosphate-dependent enzyme [Actinomadura syzygii]|uniref:tryptophan synthase n=1 Tax=Actinomadura syzygii TaxID=1427538 RepID=A0A5D0TYB6_9ACTN|nr:TrpB-like pyridoxal phosphate-dependent enzyme [Actinomadura syzygii]TYC10335.1 TrpB-like pyridoxal phosphate-dependent enzyme [Actinomadura syzygii]